MDIGKHLEEHFLIPLHISQSRLAKELHIPKTRVSDIINGKRAISADTDLRLCRFFSLEEGYFLKLQIDVELQKAKKGLKKKLLQIEPRKDVFHNKEILFEAKTVLKKVNVALLCGGPSLERGISLNSARSVLDHLSREEVEIHPIYVDVFKNFYSLSKAQLYSNTPSDFDFKLQTAGQRLSSSELVQFLKQMDLVFPVIHGTFGEDGELQSFLEQHHIPFVGSDSRACQKCFDKHNAFTLLKRHGYHTIPTEVLRKNSLHLEKDITDFFHTYTLGRVVIKPIAGGSSIGVSSAYSPQEAFQKAEKLFQITGSDEALIEPFCFGKEFTIIVLQNPDSTSVSLVPTEIQVDYDNGGLFDYRRKYLPTANTHWFCPPRFEDSVVQEIRKQAEELFQLFHMRDFARLDGWVLNDGRIIFTDFNPLSGMEQNSFIFQQASRIGLTHGDLLWNILCNACKREGIAVQERRSVQEEKKEEVHILFGGSTAERQVSLMSGTNVWLKLRKSKKYQPSPYLLDQNSCVWHLPYTYALNHTVEEIYENCLTAEATVDRMEKFHNDIKKRLAFAPQQYRVRDQLPVRRTFHDFLEQSKKKEAFIFLALHGGEGENGTLQDKLEKKGLLYNGSKPKASELCMDKYLTGQAIASMGSSTVLTVPKKPIKISSLNTFSKKEFEQFWAALQKELSSETCIIKPQRDGCSAGIVRLFAFEDLQTYSDLVRKKISFVPAGTFKNQPYPVEMPFLYDDEYLLEAFVETDFLRISKNEVVYTPKTGWLELTVGVLEKEGVYHALNPSITIAEGEVLSVEEKFQGGTGVNITPPLESIISVTSRKRIKSAIESIAKALSIQNYARIDLFFNVQSKKIYVIEANTLPGLTPATVLYHQALAEESPLYPTEFLEHLIDGKMRRS